MNEQYLQLLTRILAGEASVQEELEWERLLSSDAELKKEAEIYQRFWQENVQIQKPEVDAAFSKLSKALNLETALVDSSASVGKVRGLWLNVLKVAVVLLLAVAGFWFFKKRSGREENNNEIVKQTPKGVKSIIELSDGSKIWLNSDSKVEYPPFFPGSSREITLHGEAFFEVAKNPKKPFIIHLDKGTIRVLGTSFNVRAYDNMTQVETSVVTGKVAFIPKLKNNRSGDTVFLLPNHKVVYSPETEMVKTASSDALDAKAWIEGRMIFRSMTLEEIGTELERNFGVHVRFMDEEPRGYKLTGSFQNNNLSEILYYLSRTKTFHYELENDTLRISK